MDAFFLVSQRLGGAVACGDGMGRCGLCFITRYRSDASGDSLGYMLSLRNGGSCVGLKICVGNGNGVELVPLGTWIR